VVLALDTASPVVSVAAARPSGVIAERREELRRSSVRLLGMIDEVLAEAGVRVPELAGVVALAGPGSFTGLRVGLAPVRGLHLATGVAAPAVSTLETRAGVAMPARVFAAPDRVSAAVDVLRGEWAVQAFALGAAGPGGGDPVRPLGAPVRMAAAELVARASEPGAVAIGFGVRALFGDRANAGAPAIEPASLAPAAALAAARHPPAWDPAALTAPVYSHPPPATPPRPAAAIGAGESP
jgi:tRNA threonylcarbamoyladenosine biosynthesis protein TsaB